MRSIYEWVIARIDRSVDAKVAEFNRRFPGHCYWCTWLRAEAVDGKLHAWEQHDCPEGNGP